MRKKEKIQGIIIIIIIIFIAININGINDFLSVHKETIDFGHSTAVVAEPWTTTEKLNQTNASKTPNAITNEYIYIDHWDDWPEDHITSISQDKFKEMENGHYKVLKNDNTTISGIKVYRQYFSNPTRNNYTVCNHVGVNYVFAKEDANYTIQVHYFTTQDYNNDTFMKTIEDSIAEDINNVHNKDYNGFLSTVKQAYDLLTGWL